MKKVALTLIALTAIIASYAAPAIQTGAEVHVNNMIERAARADMVEYTR